MQSQARPGGRGKLHGAETQHGSLRISENGTIERWCLGEKKGGGGGGVTDGYFRKPRLPEPRDIGVSDRPGEQDPHPLRPTP